MVLALVLAACGGGDKNASTTPKQTAAPHAKAGGDLQFLFSGDVDNINPGITYYTGGYLIVYATQLQGREALMTTTLDGKIKARLPSQTADLREPVWGPYGR